MCLEHVGRQERCGSWASDGDAGVWQIRAFDAEYDGNHDLIYADCAVWRMDRGRARVEAESLVRRLQQ